MNTDWYISILMSTYSKLLRKLRRRSRNAYYCTWHKSQIQCHVTNHILNADDVKALVSMAVGFSDDAVHT